MSDRNCPDCGVPMEETNVTAEGVGDLYVETSREDGVLQRLGIGDHSALDAHLCPECGLTRLYADVEA